MRFKLITSSLLALMFMGCEKQSTIAPKFERLEDAVKAIEQENLKIDESLDQLKQIGS